LKDLFHREQKVLDDARNNIIELQKGADFDVEILESLVDEYSSMLEQKKKILKISDKVAEVLLNDRISLNDKIMEMEILQQKQKALLDEDKRLRVQCFGNFDVFKGLVPIYFPRKKAKELFAYLVHKRGTSCTTQEVIAVLFEDSTKRISVQKQAQTIISAMMKVLRDAEVDDVVAKEFNSISIKTGKINCDYYRFLERDEEAMNQYMGEYMTNYSWAEFMVGYLDSKVIKG